MMDWETLTHMGITGYMLNIAKDLYSKCYEPEPTPLGDSGSEFYLLDEGEKIKITSIAAGWDFMFPENWPENIILAWRLAPPHHSSGPYKRGYIQQVVSPRLAQDIQDRLLDIHTMMTGTARIILEAINGDENAASGGD